MKNWTNYITSWYNYRSDILNVIIEEGVTSIGNYAFSGCTNLTDITISNTVKSIGNAAFSNTDLTEINIPDNVTSIGSSAFNRCVSGSNISADLTCTLDFE